MIISRLVLASLAAMVASPAFAVIAFDQNVTNNAIFGSGNGNGGFTTDRTSGLEIGLRAKVRYPTPAGVYNSNGDGSYTHQSGSGAPNRAFWNFEWSVNTDYDGTTGNSIGDLTYQLSIDFDPGVGTTDFMTWNPINPTPGVAFGGGGFVADHSFGNNSTAQSAGVEAGDAATYATLLSNNNLVQQSWNMGFFDTPFDASLVDADATAGTKVFDFDAVGEYTITLEAFDGGALVGSNTILIQAVPEPTAALFGSLLAGGMGMTIARRRRSQSDEN